jgi:hypothetical protein
MHARSGQKSAFEGGARQSGSKTAGQIRGVGTCRCIVADRTKFNAKCSGERDKRDSLTGASQHRVVFKLNNGIF